MVSKSLITLVLGSIISQVVCDTRGLYEIQPQTQNQQHLAQAQNSDNFYDPTLTSSFTTPRFGTGLWNPFENFSLDLLVQPVATIIGIIVGLSGFFQLSKWGVDLLEVGRQKVAAKKAEKEAATNNEVDEARRKRMVSAEESERVLRSIETAERNFGQ